MRPGTEMFLDADGKLTETGLISLCPLGGAHGHGQCHHSIQRI